MHIILFDNVGSAVIITSKVWEHNNKHISFNRGTVSRVKMWHNKASLSDACAVGVKECRCASLLLKQQFYIISKRELVNQD